MKALDLAIAFARGRWMAALDRGFRQNKTRGDVSEKLLKEIEEKERKFHELQEVKREHAK
jgi:hypothetical protein